MIRFALLFEGRTGSTFLRQHMVNHSMIRMAGEIFTISTRRLNTVPLKDLIREQKQMFYERIVNPAGLKPRVRAVGFKTKFRDVLDPPAFAASLQEYSFRILRMRRRNIVKQAISGINILRIYPELGEYNTSNPEPWQRPFMIPPADFRKSFDALQEREKRLDAFVESLNLPVLEIFYEDLVNEPEPFLRKVFSYLEVPWRPTASALRKLMPDNLREIITNLDELAAMFSGTPLEGMFYEGSSREMTGA